ncbi:hypothetical protein C21_04737 [Arenibacter sp. NBRC 103722]|uniref:PIN domain-containing protein n=1 Tax=Arenibacter sp. NBRC 103722 TaxID=1113929 RepID=UPI000853627F|nr:hypothetical protein [Arenibacter sp. NBRC 103722]GBF22542.1 hypothetical protein C21_04737 [Arenibacter sp. NBRC 103722]
MEPLSTSVILKGIGIALKIPQIVSQFHTGNLVADELDKTFEKALKSWAPNESIRKRKRQFVKQKVEKYLEFDSDIDLIEDREFKSFCENYAKHLAAHSAAFNYVSGIRSNTNFGIINSQLGTIKDDNVVILQKISDMAQMLENNLPSNGGKLEEEWKRQIGAYKESISKFKPKTALDLLNKMEESFIFHNVKPSNNLLSTLNFLKAQCFGMLGSATEMYECSIMAHSLGNTSIEVIERACYSYAKTNNFSEARKLILKLKSIDEYNPTAWATEVILSGDLNLAEVFSKIPHQVIQNLDFKRIVYFNIIANSNFEVTSELYQKYRIFPETKYFETFPKVTLENYKNWYFIIQTVLSELFRSTIINSQPNPKTRSNQIKLLNGFLNHFLEQMSSAEMQKDINRLYFFYWFTEFSINKKNDPVFNMKIAYSKLKERDRFVTILMVNSLYKIKDLDGAIEIAGDQNNGDIDLLNIKALCELEREYYEDYIVTVKELLLLIKHVDLNNAELVFNIIHMLSLIQKLDEFDETLFVESKSYELDFLRKFIKCFIDFEKGRLDSEQFEFLQSIEEPLLKSQSIILFYLPFIYYKSEKYDLANEVFSKYVSEEYESRDLYYYILSLEKSCGNHSKLLYLLKKWRVSFPFDDMLLGIEADLNRQLPNWIECKEICEYFLENKKDDEGFMTLQLIALNEINPKKFKKEIAELAEFLQNYDFKIYQHVRIVSSILIENEFYEEGLKLIFNAAFKTENIQARLDFIFSTIKIPSGIIKEFEVVKKGCYVKYILDGKTNFVKIQEGNDLADKLLGRKVGDTVSMQRPIVNTLETIKVVRIMDKYLYLHDLILEEVKSNPYSGIPLQSFDFKDGTIEGMHETFKSLFGAKGTIIKDETESALKKYYNYELSFTELIIQVYSSNYIGGYFDLVLSRDGIVQLPITMYPSEHDYERKEFVIDFSSLIILQKISEKLKTNFQNKFFIAKGSVDFIRGVLKREITEPKEKMSLRITHDEVKPYLHSENATNSNIEYLNKLLNWIKLNCIESVVESKLDIIRKLKHPIENEIFDTIIIENYSLAIENENRILITDDTFYLKLFPLNSLRNISSEIYVKSCEGKEGDCLSSFIENKYIGFTVDSKMLFNEFKNKLKSKPNKYDHCVHCISLSLLPGTETIRTAVNFLKQINLKCHLTDDKFQQEATKVFFYLLKGQIEMKLFRITDNTIKQEFKLLGAKLDLVYESYLRAIEIIGMSANNKASLP